jgi:hypothetical protein
VHSGVLIVAFVNLLPQMNQLVKDALRTSGCGVGNTGSLPLKPVARAMPSTS